MISTLLNKGGEIFIKGIRLACSHIKKCWKKYSVISLIGGAIWVVSSWSSIQSVFFDISNKELREQFAGALSALNSESAKTQQEAREGTERVLDTLEEKDGISCTNMSDLWVADGSAQILEQFLILKDGQNVGSARLTRRFSNLFTLDFLFLPSSFSTTATTISLKDNENNELVLTIKDSKIVNSIYKKEGLLVSGAESNVELSPTIDPTQEIKLRIQTVWNPDSISVKAAIEYSFAQRPGQRGWESVLNTELPTDYLTQDDVNLNIGLYNSRGIMSEQHLKLINCRIREADRP